jgi:lambda repressor-like predicted transcriptional regulator
MSKRTSTTIDWDKIIKRWKESGISQRRFCTQEEISLSTLHYHLRNYRQKAGFIEISESFRNQTIPTPIEVILPMSGMTIKVEAGFCKRTLKELLEVLVGGKYVH